MQSTKKEIAKEEQLKKASLESKQNYPVLLSLFKLKTSFGPCTGPSSGHKIRN